MARASRFDVIEEARMLARANGMFVVSAGMDLVLYRRVAPSVNVRVGARSSPEAFRDLVRRAAGSA